MCGHHATALRKTPSVSTIMVKMQPAELWLCSLVVGAFSKQNACNEFPAPSANQ